MWHINPRNSFPGVNPDQLWISDISGFSPPRAFTELRHLETPRCAPSKMPSHEGNATGRGRRRRAMTELRPGGGHSSGRKSRSLDENRSQGNAYSWQFFVAFLGWLSDPFKWLSDLQLGDEKVTLNHLVSKSTPYIHLRATKKTVACFRGLYGK